MFNRSPSASIRKFDRIGMVVLRSTTLCVAVSSFTRSWRLTVISIAAPCAAGFSTSVSTIGIAPPSIRSQVPVLATLYNTLQPGESGYLFLFLLYSSMPEYVRGKQGCFSGYRVPHQLDRATIVQTIGAVSQISGF